MTSTMVTVGGNEIDGGAPPRPPSGRGPVFVVAGLAAGLVLGILFTGSEPAEPVAPTETVVASPASTPTTRPPSTTTTDVVPSRLATMAPGVLDTLVVSGVDRNGMSTVTAWRPADRIPTVQNLPWGPAVADASRTWLASYAPSRWTSGTTLWVGNTAYMEPVSTALVSGPVWHTRLPGRLAWVEDTVDGPVLVRAEFVAGRSIQRVVVAPFPTGGLVAWTDAGFVVEDAEGVEIRDEVGAVSATAAGIPIGVGTLIATTGDRDQQMLLSATLDPIGPVPWQADCFRIEWSPGGVAALAWCGGGSDERVEYWGDPTRDTDPSFVAAGSDYVDLGFTSNGIPFVASIDPIRPSSQIVFYHPADGSTHAVTYPGRIQHLLSLAG